jgi:signal transduction histidine kinase
MTALRTRSAREDAISRSVMTVRRFSAQLTRRLRHPQTTVRWRLTLLYGGLFLACGAGLLAITYTLVAHAAVEPPSVARVPFPEQRLATAAAVRAQVRSRPSVLPRFSAKAYERLIHSRTGDVFARIVSSGQRIADLHQLELWSGIALAIMAVLSSLLGWLVAGRVLAPLRTITGATQRISGSNLHERLAMGGPRDELRQLADTIDGLLQRLEAAFEAQRRFVANASHELRTPLTTMRASLDVAIAKPHVPSQLRALDANLRQDLDQADELLESFLVLARVQHRELGAQTSVSLAQVTGEALARRGEAIAAKRIELHTAVSPVRVTGSETLLARMVDNLIDNAVRHNQSRGFIRVTTAADGDTARLVIESGGPVLDQGAVTQLAQPFRRLGADRTGSHNGHGLGLSIVASIAAAHGGDLSLHARQQGGLRAEISLPADTVVPVAAVNG